MADLPNPFKMRTIEFRREVQRIIDELAAAKDERGLRQIAGQLDNVRSSIWLLKDTATYRADELQFLAAQEGPPKVSLSAEELQLYTDMKGAKQAARSISSALNKAIKAFYKWVDAADDVDEPVVEGKLYDLYEKFMSPVMSKYAKQGAADTEPRGVVWDELERVAKGKTGLRIRLNNPRQGNPGKAPTLSSLSSKLRF